MRDFRKYKVWEQVCRILSSYRHLVFGALSHQVTLFMYKISQNFPKGEMFGITSQMRRAAYSIPSNIAEGCGRESDAEFKRFLVIAQDSSSELEYFAILARDFGYIDDSVYFKLDDSINKPKRSLFKLIQKL